MKKTFDINNWTSTHISNILSYGSSNFTKYYQDYRDLCQCCCFRWKELLPKLYGKAYCITFPRKRLWIWQHGIATIVVSKEGLDFEVQAGSSSDEAFEAWNDFYTEVKKIS